MNQNDDIKIITIELGRIFFPKGRVSINSGEYGIFVADIQDRLKNADDLIGDTIKLKGNCCEVKYGEHYKVSCKLSEKNEKYGDTYEIIHINTIVDLSNSNKLESFMGAITTTRIASELIKLENIVDILENEDTESLCKVKGVGLKAAQKLINKYQDSKDYTAIYSELGHIGLTTKLIKRLVAFYNSAEIVVKIVKEDPYRLVEVDGIGFKTSDDIALKLGVQKSGYKRVGACMRHILNENGESGRSYLNYNDLIAQTESLIGRISGDVMIEVANELISKGVLMIGDNGNKIGLKKYYNLEERIARELKRLNGAKSTVIVDDLENSIKQTELSQGFNFTDEQKEGIYLFVRDNVCAITGCAGSGKTSVSKGMIDSVIGKYTITAAALSGKAAVRITEATGLTASTIHRLLKYKNGSFEYNRRNPIPTSVVFIDEATMINGDLFLSLLRAIPSGAKLVMMGDVQQLTPIGSCQVFADVLNSKTIHSVKLNKPHRQALRSGIIPLSMNVIEQKPIFDKGFIGTEVRGELQDMELKIFKKDDYYMNVIIESFMNQFKITNNLMETQIIAPLKNRGNYSTYILNNEIQKIVNPINGKPSITLSSKKDMKFVIQVGDKVINTKNNYNVKTPDGGDVVVFNGNMGMVKFVDKESIVIDFVGIGEVVMESNSWNSLELGYAITVHKSQGSGFENVIGIIDSSAYVLLNAELLYTLLTRAKKYCTLIGTNNAINMAISKREVKTKVTYLGELI